MSEKILHIDENDIEPKESKESQEKSLIKKSNNFHYFFFGQKINDESVTLIDGFPKLQSNKCIKNCCCQAMVCYCNQLNFEEAGSQEELFNNVTWLNHSESKSKQNLNDSPIANQEGSTHMFIELQEKEIGLTGSDNDKSNLSNNLLQIKKEVYFKDLTNNIIDEIIEKSDSKVECYLENLSVDHSTPVGGSTISVQLSRQSDSKFIVYSSSKYHEYKVNVGCELVSIVGKDLKTIEENKIQHKKEGDTFKEHKYYIKSDKNIGYDLKITINDGLTKTTESKIFNNDIAKDCILEGAHIVLLRYLAITKYEGEFKTKSISICGECCDNIYVCNIIEGMLVENQKIPLLRVTQTIIDSDSYMKKSFFYLTLRGSLVRYECSDSKYVVHLNPLLPINPDTNEITRQVPLRKNWQNDMELFSKYMDFKNNRLVENESYFTNHTHLRALLSDYLEKILLMKPKEVLPFTRSFFGSFTQRLDLPHNSYFEETD